MIEAIRCSEIFLDSSSSSKAKLFQSKCIFHPKGHSRNHVINIIEEHFGDPATAERYFHEEELEQLIIPRTPAQYQLFYTICLILYGLGLLLIIVLFNLPMFTNVVQILSPISMIILVMAYTAFFVILASCRSIYYHRLWENSVDF